KSDAADVTRSMPVLPSVVEAIGNTPLIRLRRVSEQTGCEILGKAEFLNPGQSVKDRPARQMILEAEKRRDIRPGGLIVEGTAGKEILEQTGGRIDAFICSVGTGGTLAGVSMYLREKKPGIVIGCADPEGAAMFSLFTTGATRVSPGESITEGIGLGRMTAMVEDIVVDEAYVIPDREALPLIFDLVEHEGLILGGSSGINIAGAVRLARAMGPGHIIVT